MRVISPHSSWQDFNTPVMPIGTAFGHIEHFLQTDKSFTYTDIMESFSFSVRVEKTTKYTGSEVKALLVYSAFPAGSQYVTAQKNVLYTYILPQKYMYVI